MNPETEFREGLDELAVHYKEVLKLLGEDPEREGLVKTPMRVAKAMQVLTRGYTQDPHKVRLLLDVRTPHAAILWQGSRGIHPQRTHHRTEQDSPRGGHLQPSSSGAGAPHTANQGLHTGNPQTSGRDGSHRSQAYVHADERCGKAEQHHDNKRL